MKDADEKIGALVRAARVARGLNQSELGNRLGLSFQQLQKYEAGKNRISAARLWQISKILNVSVSYFFDGLIDPAQETARRPGEAAPPPKRVIDLAQRVWDIPDPTVRKRLLMLMEALGQQEPAEHKPFSLRGS